MPKRKRSKSPNLDLIEDGFDDELDSNDDKSDTPIQRNAANARERARMRVLSKAFFNLKRNIPWVPADTKLSKLDTLRLAKNYISYLAATLDGQSVENISTNLGQPAKTAWPFIFQPVQPHDATSNAKASRLVSVVSRTDKNGIKSQPSTAASAPTGSSFAATADSGFEESRSLNQQYHHAIVHHHHQNQNHRGHSSAADAGNHLHGYSHLQHHHLVHSMSD
ncbi:neurogenic differentiation factor 1 [Culex pipiens pallens]|uniref:Transcription factor 21 n=1 Tax=Culex pipiens TaxID=7175 RepID=A0A8D8F3C0_CULPI|nr:neurogenic differentiation factor 1 [Culex pipiens pallens]